MDTPFAGAGGASDTRNRILLESAILFAHDGYAAVSIRDIADRCRIKAASIYNYFKGKEELFEVIVENIKDIYLGFYDRTDEKMEKAGGFKDVLDNLFDELKEVYDIFIYYGFSLVASEQFRNQKARDVFNKVLIGVGIDYTTAKFDLCVERGWVKPFDTRGLATLFTNSVFVGTLMRTHEDMGHETPYDPKWMFEALYRHMLESVEVIE